MKRIFYYAGTFNLYEPNDNIGASIARLIIPDLEKLSGDKCLSRWAWSTDHENSDFRKTMATTDIMDLAQADYCVFVPLTKQSRGCHVEMGIALALDKPSYLYRPNGEGHTAFDVLFMDMPVEWKYIIDREVKKYIIDREVKK